MIRIAVLISGRGSNMLCLADAAKTHGIKAQITVVISNNDCAGIQLAKDRGLPTQIIKRKDFDSKAHQESTIANAINILQVDYVFLAGYMSILGDDFLNKFSGRIINIHPSLLPAFKGLNTHQRAIDNGAATHGVSVHLVTSALDNGPMILQASLPLHIDDTVDNLAARVLQLEHQIYPFVLFGLARQYLFLTPEGACWRSPLSAIEDAPTPIQSLLAPCLIWPEPTTIPS